MKHYEVFYAKLVSEGAQLLLTSIQISEFINRCIRLNYELEKKSSHDNEEFDFKRDYRNTEDYRNNMQAILEIVENDILPHFTVIDDHFSEIPSKKLYLYGFSYDFNDAFLVQVAEIEKAEIITHDIDFCNYNTKVNILTANPKLFMFS